jgi:hypothetical protein
MAPGGEILECCGVHLVPHFEQCAPRKKGGEYARGGRVHKSPILVELLGECTNFGNFFLSWANQSGSLQIIIIIIIKLNFGMYHLTTN